LFGELLWKGARVKFLIHLDINISQSIRSKYLIFFLIFSYYFIIRSYNLISKKYLFLQFFFLHSKMTFLKKFLVRHKNYSKSHEMWPSTCSLFQVLFYIVCNLGFHWNYNNKWLRPISSQWIVFFLNSSVRYDFLYWAKLWKGIKLVFELELILKGIWFSLCGLA